MKGIFIAVLQKSLIALISIFKEVIDLKPELTQEKALPNVEVNLDEALVKNVPKPKKKKKISIQLTDSYKVNLDGRNVEVKVSRRTRSITGAELKGKLGIYKGDNLFCKYGTKWKKVPDSKEFDLREDLDFNTVTPIEKQKTEQPSFSSLPKALAD